MKTAKTGAALGLTALTIASTLSIGQAATAAPSTSSPASSSSPANRAAPGDAFGVVRGQTNVVPVLVDNRDAHRANAALRIPAPSGTTWADPGDGVLYSAEPGSDPTQAGSWSKVVDGIADSRCTLYNGGADLSCFVLSAPGVDLPRGSYAFVPRLSVPADQPALVTGSFGTSTDNRLSAETWIAPQDAFSMQSSYSAATDSFQLSGTTEQADNEIFVSGDDGLTWTRVGRASGNRFDLALDPALATGPILLAREGTSGSGTRVAERTTAVEDLEVVVEGNTRYLSGRAQGGAIVHLSTSRLSDDDVQIVTAPSNGVLDRIPLDGAAGNATSIVVWQGDDGVRTTVDLKTESAVAPVAGTVVFPANRDYEAIVHGTATPFATIIVRDAAGTEVSRRLATYTGTWAAPVPAPNAAGDHVVTVSQEVDGEPQGETSITISYGAAVQVTSPGDGATHTGGPVTLTGTGEPGGRITVRDGDTGRTLGLSLVREDGSWTNTTTTLDDRTRVLEVRQLAKGNNTITSTLTLNPDAGEITPIEVTNPKDVADGFAPNAPFTFEGTGHAGRTVTVINKYGTLLGTTTVGADGTWAWTRADMGTSTWYLGFAQDRGLDTQSVDTVTGFAPNQALAPEPGPTLDMVVTAPADPAAGYTPNSPFTFEGTGTAGTTLTIENAYGTPLASTTVDADGTWSWTRANMGTSTWKLVFVQDKGEASQASMRLPAFAPAR